MSVYLKQQWIIIFVFPTICGFLVSLRWDRNNKEIVVAFSLVFQFWLLCNRFQWAANQHRIELFFWISNDPSLSCSLCSFEWIKVSMEQWESSSILHSLFPFWKPKYRKVQMIYLLCMHLRFFVLWNSTFFHLFCFVVSFHTHSLHYLNVKRQKQTKFVHIVACYASDARKWILIVLPFCNSCWISSKLC